MQVIWDLQEGLDIDGRQIIGNIKGIGINTSN